MSLKILHTADLHLEREWFEWVAARCVDFDLLVIAGDLQNAFSNAGMYDQARAISRWLVDLRVPAAVCSGNHDYWVQNPRAPVDPMAEAGWLNVLQGQGSGLLVDGHFTEGPMSVYVNGWLQSPEYRGQADIVVSHAPPAGCACASGAEGRDNGDPNLWSSLDGRPPTLLLCGHVHMPSKRSCLWPPVDPTTLVLVPGCDEQHEVPAHWIIDTVARTAVHSGGEAASFPG